MIDVKSVSAFRPWNLGKVAIAADEPSGDAGDPGNWRDDVALYMSVRDEMAQSGFDKDAVAR
jgi:hypothetical protein